MKKKRGLALLMALSLAVSTNGMTTFAAEAKESMPPVVSVVGENPDDVQDEAEQTAAADHGADDGQNIDSENTEQNGEISDASENTEQNGETSDASENTEQNGETGDDSENTGKNGQAAADSENAEQNGEAGADSTEDQAGKDADGTSGEQDSDASGGDDSDVQDSDADDKDDETVSGNALPDEEVPAVEETGKLPVMIVNEVRMVTFTDDTGLKITYDANATKNYKYIVENGVLLRVLKDSTDVSGNSIWEDETFEGNVVLSQPEEGEKYTSVAPTLFSGNKNITYVKLPDGVTGIGDDTFKDCTALKGAYLPATVTSIGTSAFESCTSMTQIAIPNTVSAIGNSAFKYDAKLYMMYMKDVNNSALASVGDSAFEGCYALAEFCSDTGFYLPASLKSIGEKAFYQCRSIEKVDLSTAELETAGTSAFEDCAALKSVVMGKKLTEIPASAFRGCTSLELIKFSGVVSVTVGEYAFYGCYSLKQLELPATVRKVSRYAFAGCTNLSNAVVENPGIELETDPFPAGKTRDCLVFVGKKYMDKTDQNTITSIYTYYLGLDPVKVAFVDPSENNSKEYYTYKVADSDGTIRENGILTGGQIWVCPEGKNLVEDNINTLNGKKGVPSDGTKYYIYNQPRDGYELVKGSLKSNGETVQKDDKGRYYITMPYGGTVITAEFREKNATDKIEGGENDITIEFSNGEPIQPDGVELKIGQTTRMFILDKNGKAITASQIKEISSDKTDVATVSASGVITAVGAGKAWISAELTGGDGIPFRVRSMVSVVEGTIASIRLNAKNYNENIIKVDPNADGIQTAAVGKNYARDGLTFILEANAYTAEGEPIRKELTWTSSDKRVAELEKRSTASGDSINQVKIPAGTAGEATITVTAKIDSKNTVIQKFVVSVRDYKLKLSSSTVTINPNLEEHGELEILSAYGVALPSDGNQPKLIEKSEYGWVGNSSFLLEAKPQTESDIKSGRRRYSITLRNDTLKDGKYQVYVCFDDTARDSSLPLTIKVKRSVPAPTVKFNTKKTKFNLFYKNGGTDKDGNPITVTTEVTKLGMAMIRKVELCALSDKEDDLLFLENFEIIDSPEDLVKGIIKIRKKDGNLRYTKSKKPALTGYLKLYYEGYGDTVAKKVKVTMPTVTTAPAYVLDRTSVTYRNTAGSQTETLEVFEKKAKTKKKITLNEYYELKVDSPKSIVNQGSVAIVDGNITFDISYPDKDKLKLSLKNPTEWDKDKNGADRTLSYTFRVKTTDAEPTIKVNQTVTLSLNYPDAAAAFTLVSSQKDTQLQETQIFTPKSSEENADEYDKLEVSYQNGKGLVKIKEGRTVKAGTYKWICYPEEKGFGPLRKATTLTVKVVNSKPVFKLGKGSLVLNLAAATTTDAEKIYEETAEIPLKITGKPEGYTLDSNVNAGNGSTEIESTTSNRPGAAANFDWTLQDSTFDQDGKLVDGKLSVSVKNNASLSTGTYSFKMTAKYVNPENGRVVAAKPMTFKVKVIYNNAISVTFSAKGKLNLVDREGETTAKNTIVYTPKLKNVSGTITDAWIYDADTNEESKRFDIYLNPKDGKLYVTPKKTLVNIGPGDNTGTGGGGNEPGGGNETGGGDEPGGGDGSVSENEPGDGSGSVSGNEPGDGNGSVSGNEPGGESGSVSGNEPGGESGGGAETGGETGSGSGTESGDESGIGGGNEPGGESGSVSGNETGGESGSGGGTESGGEAGSGGGTESGGESGTGGGNESGGESGSVSGNETGGETGTGDGTETDAGTKTGVRIGIGNENAGNNSGEQAPPQGDVVQGYEYAALENNRQYRVKIEVKVAGYNGGRGDHKGILSTPITIKTAQVLPKVTTDKSTLDVFLSNKQYDAAFTVIPQNKINGIVDEIKFDDDDKVSQDSFDISYVTQPNGSLRVIVHLKEAVDYPCDSTNQVKMYIKFKGQGTNTPGTLVNMNIRVNK